MEQETPESTVPLSSSTVLCVLERSGRLILFPRRIEQPGHRESYFSLPSNSAISVVSC